MPTRSPINYSPLTPYTPYITKWSEEHQQRDPLIAHPNRGISYLEPTPLDRDNHGVLWERTPLLRGRGHPLFKVVHPLRQRRAMQRLLCNVCGGPADQNDQGTLWLIRDYRDDWPGWPNRMGVTEPPVCTPCAHLAARVCPSLRKGAVAVRVGRAPISGVRGVLYRRDGNDTVPVEIVTVLYDDPIVRWVRASYLVRELLDCTIVPLEEACQDSTAS